MAYDLWVTTNESYKTTRALEVVSKEPSDSVKAARF